MKLAPSGAFYPPPLFDEFFLTRSRLTAVNETLTSFDVTLTLTTMSQWRFMASVMLDHSFEMHESIGSMADGEKDDFKTMLSETNVWFLALTGAVSLLHSAFDFMAFKNGTPPPPVFAVDSIASFIVSVCLALGFLDAANNVTHLNAQCALISI
jgi:hypothetical protein